MTLVNDGIFEEVTVQADIMDQETLGIELMFNAGFEVLGGGDPDVFASWVESTAGNDTIEAEPILVHAGNYAAKITNVDSGTSSVRQTKSVTPGENYKLTYWTRGNGSVAGRISIYNSSNPAWIISLESTGVTGTTYIQKTFYFTAPAGCSSIIIYLYAPGTTGSAYFDDISFREVTAPGKGSFNALTAGSSEAISDLNDTDFRDGDIGNWGVSADGAGTLAYNTTDIGGVDDKQALLTSSGDAFLYGVLALTYAPLSANTWYKLTANVYVPAGNTNKTVEVIPSALADATQSNPSEILPGDTWVEYVNYVYVAADVIGGIAVGFNGNPADGDKLYFDNISIKKINTAWMPYGTNTMALVDDGNGGEALEITYVDNAGGALLTLRDVKDLTRDLVFGEQLKISFDIKIGSGDSVEIKISQPTETIYTSSSTSFESVSYYCNSASVASKSLYFASMGTGEIVTINNLKVEPVTLDEWTEGDGWGPATDGSGAQEDKAYFYKGSGDLEQDISAEAGKIYHLGYTLDVDEQELNIDADNAASDEGTEADATTGFTPVSLTGTGANIFESQSAIKNVGSFALHANSNDAPISGARIWKDIEVDWGLVNGKSYRISIDARHVGSGGDWFLRLGVATASTNHTIGTLSSTDITFATYTLDFIYDSTHRYLVIREGAITNDGGVYIDNISCVAGVIPEIGGQEGTPEFEDGSYAEDILAINTNPLKFKPESSMEFTIDDVEVFSEVTIYVDKAATGANDGTSWLDAFITIQAGINDAAGGDHVVCAPGTYTGAGNQNLDYGPAPNNFRVSSLFPLQAIIDCENTAATRGIVFENAETTDSIFEGFQVINGVGPASIGGGIYVNGTSPTIKNSWIRNNFAALLGGGVYVAGVGADPTLENCLITENEATVWAGGIGVNSVATGITLKNVTVINNTAGVDFAGVDIQIVTGITNTIIYGNNGTVTNENQITGTPTYSIWDWSNTTGDITSGAGVLDAGSVNPNLNTKYQPRNPLVNKGGTDSIYSDLVRDIYGIQLTDISGSWLRGFGPMGAALNLPGATISPVITNVITDVITDAVLGSN